MPYDTFLLDELNSALPAKVRARPADADCDPASIADLSNRARGSVGDPFLDTADEVAAHLSFPDMDAARDAVVVEADEAGAPVGYAIACAQVDSAKPRVFLFGAVDPDWVGRGIGRALLAWARARAEERLAGAPGGTIQVQCGDTESATHALLRHAGFRPIRRFLQLQLRFNDRPTGTDPGAIRLPVGYAPLPLGAVPLENVHLLHDAAFADHWGVSSTTLEQWRAIRIEPESHRPGYSEVVVADGSLVAYLLAAESPQDAETTGRVLWVDLVGVAREHRGRGLATALIERLLARARRDGFDGVMIDVDAASLTGANQLYERIGFRRFHGAVRWILEDADFS